LARCYHTPRGFHRGSCVGHGRPQFELTASLPLRLGGHTGSHSAFGRKKVVMSNPWTKKNPLMSMWLSAANKTMGSARGYATGAAKRQIATTQAEAVKQIVDFWSGKPTRPPARKRTRR
jgi:hypothetical protein